MNFTTLEIVQQQHVATIWMNRPDVRNAFDEQSIAELTQAFHALDQDRAVRAIVLAARGSAFSAGADLNWMKRVAGYTEAENRADAQALAEMLHVIYQSSKPTIARVQGDCYAGGNAMGERAAHRYFLTAERFNAPEAYRLGYVHQVVAAEALDEAVTKMTHHLLAGSPHAIDESKRLIREIAGEPIDQHLIADTARRIGEVRVAPDGREGIAAFLEKRKPSWLTR